MAKNTVFSKKYTLNIGGNVLSLKTPKVMGILNVTPDSFYDGGRVAGVPSALEKAEQMINEGATFLDIGGYSSRPGAQDMPIEEEKERVLPVIKVIKSNFPDVYLSIDTFRSTVAEAALDNGADLVNDISGGELDEHMFDVIARYRVPYCLMHMKGTPKTMTHHTHYEDLLVDILDYFQKKVDILHKKGVSDIILDPGFGFAKTRDQNFSLLRELNQFCIMEQPILIGVSRKSMIYKSLELSAEQALNGTSVLNTIGLMNGANILRVHDVKAAVEAIRLVELTYNKNEITTTL